MNSYKKMVQCIAPYLIKVLPKFFILPLQGVRSCVVPLTQGVALGWSILPFQGVRKPLKRLKKRSARPPTPNEKIYQLARGVRPHPTGLEKNKRNEEKMNVEHRTFNIQHRIKRTAWGMPPDGPSTSKTRWLPPK